jgi:hypothetical protein
LGPWGHRPYSNPVLQVMDTWGVGTERAMA